jgi:Cytidylate kinase-like family
MSSVTISASYGAHGEGVAQAVASELKLPFLDRAIPHAVARQLHVTEEIAEKQDEHAPSRWDQFFGAFASVEAVSTAVGITHEALQSPAAYVEATERVIRRVADTTGAVILGRAGMVVLGGRDDVLCVRLDGPLQARIAQAIADGADEATARDTQRDVDDARERYANVFYNVHQGDVRLYHLVIDSTVLPVDACVDIILRAAQTRS